MVTTTVLTGLINDSLKPNTIWKQVIAWVVVTLLSIAAYFGGLIQMGDPQWLGIVMMIIVVGLSSNGFYDIPTIKAFISSWFEKSRE